MKPIRAKLDDDTCSRSRRLNCTDLSLVQTSLPDVSRIIFLRASSGGLIGETLLWGGVSGNEQRSGLRGLSAPCALPHRAPDALRGSCGQISPAPICRMRVALAS